jgi:alpha-D-xyloside xylohydrolase
MEDTECCCRKHEAGGLITQGRGDSGTRNRSRSSKCKGFHWLLQWLPGWCLPASPLRRNRRVQRLELDRKGETIVLEPYAPNILRVTLSLKKEPALAAPGYGIIGTPAAAGWTRRDCAGQCLPVRPHRGHGGQGLPYAHPPLQSEIDIANTSTAPRRARTSRCARPRQEAAGDDRLVAGRSQPQRRTADVAATAAPPIRVLHRRRDLRFARRRALLRPRPESRRLPRPSRPPGPLLERLHAPAAPSFCVPFLVTNKGYGLLWDNPSKTTICGRLQRADRWTSEVGDRVSFFVIAGNTADEIYAGYKLLTGPTHMLPKAAYGYIQCKQRYSSQKELLAVAQGLSRPPSARGCAGGGLVLLHQDGPDGHGSQVLARSRRR